MLGLRFVSEYKDRHASYVALSLAPAIYWSSGLMSGTPQLIVRSAAVLIIASSLLYTYIVGRPFGISLDWTPTHLSGGERTPDKMSESRGNALIQDSDLLVFGEAQFSRLSSEFELKFAPSSDIYVELENRPRKEHDYNPETNVLSCENMTEHAFPLKLRVYPERSVSEAGRYHELSVIENQSGSSIVEIDVIDVRP